MGKISLLTFTAGVFLSIVSCSCASNNRINENISLVGKWENTSSSFFDSGWDQCEFKDDKYFICTNFPKEGALVLPYEGRWSFSNNKLTLTLSGIEDTLIFRVSDVGALSLVVKTEKGNVLKYSKVETFD